MSESAFVSSQAFKAQNVWGSGIAVNPNAGIHGSFSGGGTPKNYGGNGYTSVTGTSGNVFYGLGVSAAGSNRGQPSYVAGGRIGIRW